VPGDPGADFYRAFAGIMERNHRKKLEDITMWKEFKQFALKGNMLDLAVGVIIGGGFNGLITSLVNDMIMPFISLFTGKLDFTNMFIALDGNKYATLADAQAVTSTIAYGSFITGLINFLLTAFVVFLLVKQLNKLHKKEAPAPAPAPTTKVCPYCKSEIHIDAVKCPHCASELAQSGSH
jgi:large conductance mechanosensitive channel